MHQPLAAPAVAGRVDASIDEAIAGRRIVGAVVLVAKDGNVVHRRAAGFSDREAGTPMREDAIFRLASVTKPLVTAAAMRLLEEGTVTLNQRVTHWLPKFRPCLPDGSAPDITVICSPIHPDSAIAFWNQQEAPITVSRSRTDSISRA